MTSHLFMSCLGNGEKKEKKEGGHMGEERETMNSLLQNDIQNFHLCRWRKQLHKDKANAHFQIMTQELWWAEKSLSEALLFHAKPILISSIIWLYHMDWGKKRTDAIWKLFWTTVFILLLFFSHSVVSDSSWSHGLQHTRLPCPSPSPGVCSNSCPLIYLMRP